MERIVLQRLETGDEGTFGRLLEWYTGELPWRDNARNVSCIPAGTYKCFWAKSPKYSRRYGQDFYTYRLLDVPDRGGVLIHSANFMGDVARGYRSHLNGCIALGEKLGWIEGQKALLVSRPAVRGLEQALSGKAFILEVKDA